MTFSKLALLTAGAVSFAVGANAAVTDGLIGYYDMDGNGNDTSGSANINNGTLVDSTSGTFGTLEAGFDTGQKLFGTHSLSVTNGDYLSLGDPTDYQFGTDSFTIAYWIRLPANVASDPTIIGNKNWSVTGGSQGFVQAFTGGDNVKANVADGTTRADAAAVDLDTTDWSFVAMTVDRAGNVLTNYVADELVTATSKVWADGVAGQDFGADSSVPTTAALTGIGSLSAPSGFTLNVGQDGDGAGYTQLTAHIDDLAIWDRALTEAELWEIYATGRIDEVSAIPEPGSLALLGLGGLMIVRRRRA